MKELMIHVEKAVRPLRVTQGRRGAMREELLVHLQGIYDEEFEQLGDHEAAVAAAIERFGSAEEISEKLRAALPWYSAVLSGIPWFARIRNWPESTGTILWKGWSAGLLFWIVSGIPWCVLLFTKGRLTADGAIAMWLLMALYGAVFLCTVIGILGAVHGAYGQPQSSRRVMGFAAGGGIGQLAVILILHRFVNPDMSGAVYVVPFMTPLIAAGAAKMRGLAKLIRCDEARSRRVGEWEQLVLTND